MNEELIKQLSDGEFHSGQTLAELLGISRTAVWKHLRKLESMGVVVESVRGRGYRLKGGLDLLDRQIILSALSPQAAEHLNQLQVHPHINSTNSHIAAMGDAGHGVLCLAERQTAGRGRRGRQWLSPFGKNIYLSLGWTFQGGAANLEGLSLAVGLALLKGVASYVASDLPLKLKWPNDLYYSGRKLAGILIEMSGDPSGQCHVVIGIGVNVGMTSELGAAIDQPWADMTEITNALFPNNTGKHLNRNGLVTRIINELLPLVSSFAGKGFSAYRQEWQRWDLCYQQPVSVILPSRTLKGVACGVSNSGALQVEIDGEIQVFSGGEVSLRIIDDT